MGLGAATPTYECMFEKSRPYYGDGHGGCDDEIDASLCSSR
jgi:hypothetical protein